MTRRPLTIRSSLTELEAQVALRELLSKQAEWDASNNRIAGSLKDSQLIATYRNRYIGSRSFAVLEAKLVDSEDSTLLQGHFRLPMLGQILCLCWCIVLGVLIVFAFPALTILYISHDPTLAKYLGIAFAWVLLMAYAARWIRKLEENDSKKIRERISKALSGTIE